MRTEQIEAVIFDMDGLMLDSQRLATQAWREAVAAFGFCLTDEINLRLIGRNVSDANEILASSFGQQFPIGDVRQLAARNFTRLTSTTGIPTKTGLWELLAFLDAENIPLAVATSTSRTDCMHSLEKANLSSRFPVVVCGDEVTKGKPSPDLFLRAAQLLRVKPEGCIVLEDSFSGIRAASAAV